MCGILRNRIEQIRLRRELQVFSFERLLQIYPLTPKMFSLRGCWISEYKNTRIPVSRHEVDSLPVKDFIIYSKTPLRWIHVEEDNRECIEVEAVALLHRWLLVTPIRLSFNAWKACELWFPTTVRALAASVGMEQEYNEKVFCLHYFDRVMQAVLGYKGTFKLTRQTWHYRTSDVNAFGFSSGRMIPMMYNKIERRSLSHIPDYEPTFDNHTLGRPHSHPWTLAVNEYL